MNESIGYSLIHRLGNWVSASMAHARAIRRKGHFEMTLKPFDNHEVEIDNVAAQVYTLRHYTIFPTPDVTRLFAIIEEITGSPRRSLVFITESKKACHSGNELAAAPLGNRADVVKEIDIGV